MSMWRGLLWLAALLAFSATPANAIVLSQAAAPVSIVSGAQGFFDPSGRLAIGDVLGATHPPFAPAAALPAFPEGYVPRVYWIRTSFRRGSSNAAWALKYIYKVTSLDVYAQTPQGLAHAAGGFGLAGQDGALVPGVLGLPEWALHGEPVYLRIATVIDPASVSLVPLERAVAQSLQRRVAFGFFIGFFVAIGAFNLLLFLILRDRPLLYYAGIMLLDACRSIISFGVLWTVLPPLTFLGRELIYDTVALGEAVALAMFTVLFLRLREYSRSSIGVVVAGTILALSVYITDFFPLTTVAFDWTFVVTLAFYASLLYASIRASRAGMRLANLYAIGICCSVAGYAINMNSYLLPRQDLLVYALDAGACLQALVIAIAVARSVQETRTERERLIDTSRRLEQLATRDGLTGVLNRRAFDDAMHVAAARAVADRRALGVLIIDIDRFKDYNDALGHQAGDEALRAIAQVCSSCVRDEDVFARYGGEEFAAIISDTTDEDLCLVADRMCAALSELGLPHADGRPLTISIGCSSGRPANQDEADAILRAADAALYAAKRGGRNRVQLASA